MRNIKWEIGGKKENDEIFNILNIDKNELTEKAYNYETNVSEFWPTSKNNDYQALTRLVKELYKIIEEKERVYTKYNRFEIMDI